MDAHITAAQTALPWPALAARGSNPVLARSAMPQASLPAAPCGTCNVSHLCIGGGAEGRRSELDGLLIGRRRLRKGQKLCHEGEPFDFLYAVRVGTLKSTMTCSDGVEHVTAFHFPGDIIGFDGMADGTLPITVRALENVELCSIPYARLGEACLASQELRRRVSQLTGQNIVRERRTTRLVRWRLTEKRVAGFLLEIADTMRERGYSAREFNLRMSRAEIGSYLGTSLETVSRALSQFQKDGLISVHSRRIELLQPRALREFAEEGAAAA